ncbi:LytTR family DNA-binding domain-containing protein [Bacillus sp. FJAT-52991]|uniref:LytTR family DNA-binding domain-containing protein n=1 Tax=Bacillus kandeliae TaxID=3129297 RepID=A0ABZ2N6V4_9BACI
MSVFILEDDVIQAENLKRMIRDICEKHDIDDASVFATSKGERIIERIAYSSMNNIYFLDIEIKNEEQKGFKVAQEIREADERGIIVFITTHSEFAPISYQYMVSALTFIEKNLNREMIYANVEKCLLKYKKSNQVFTPVDDFILENPHATIRINFSEIEYFMTAESHRLELITANRVIRFYGKLKDVEESDERLIRCHQSYVVNLEKIVECNMREKVVILKSGASVPISRRLLRKVNTKWRNYISDNGGLDQDD